MSLRILLISVVAAAPLFAGLQRAAVGGVASVASGSSPLDGSRQDDAGTLIEESSEDDAEQDDDRIDHGWSTPAPNTASDAPGRFSPVSHPPLRPVGRARAALSRGPPSGR